MIGYLRGLVLELDDDLSLMLDVGGVGYRVTVGSRLHGRLDVGEQLTLYVHTHVREDLLALYGLVSREERKAFAVLLGAHGVGPSLALLILDQLGVDGLSSAMLNEDADALCVVPGIGKKTASRMVIDLASRFADSEARLPAVAPGAGTSLRQETRIALLELGYSNDEIQRVLGRVGEMDSLEELLRACLRELAR
ncbi:MAG: Holliday junction branch migration protein RuvA [Actinobacteria bacterium]|nr:Holliday junction branch migration protein RuvA [Actinomycetota bacterium]